jgi:putative transcriptional regulator
MTKAELKKGRVLLAEPFMLDPNFKRTAVLLCEYSTEEGGVGFVMNKPLNMRVDSLIEDFPEFDAEVFFGGPVATDTIHYVHNVGDLLDDSQPVTNGLFWGGDFEKLKFLITSDLIDPSRIRFFVGYSGWSNGQLENELEMGSWVTADMDTNYLFRSEPNDLWQQVMQNKGDRYSVISQVPDEANWN